MKQPPVNLARTLPFREDFRIVRPGELPDGWTGEVGLGVRVQGELRWVYNSREGTDKYLTTPLLDIPRDFQLTLGANVPRYSSMSIKLNGVSSPDLKIWISDNEASFADLASQKFDAPKGGVRLQLTRQREVYRLFVNRKLITLQRMPEYGDFNQITIGLSGQGYSGWNDGPAALTSISLTRHATR